MTSFQRQVIGIIARATLVPEARLTLEATPDELGIDSLGLVEAIFALEEAFGIKVPVGTAGLDTSSIGAIVAGVEALMAAAKAA